MRICTLVPVALLFYVLAASPPGDPQDLNAANAHVLADMEDRLPAWTGLARDDSVAHTGEAAGLWETRRTPEVVFRPPLRDWSAFSGFRLWLQAPPEALAKCTLTVELESDRPDTPERDCFRSSLAITWEGWREIVLPDWDFDAVGEPFGWQRIDRLRMRAQPVADGRPIPWLRIDDVALTSTQLPSEVVLGGMGHDITRWHGLVPSDEEARTGAFSGKWTDVEPIPWIHATRIPHDWSQFNTLMFSALAPEGEPRALRVRIYTDDPAESFSSYHHTVDLSEPGWQEFEIPLWDFEESDAPQGWHHISTITVIRGPPEIEPVPGDIYIDDVRLARREPSTRVALLEDDVDRWHHLSLSGDQAAEGQFSASWGNPGETPFVACHRLPSDWTAYDSISFWLWSAEPNGQEVRVRLYTGDPGLAFDSYWSAFQVSWEGWRQVVLPFWAFQESLEPAGWDHISTLTLCAGGAEVPTEPGTFFFLDDVSISREEAGADVALLDDLEVVRWKGLELTSEQAYSGGFCGKWEDLSDPPAIRCGLIPRNWEQVDELELSIYSERPTDTTIWVFLESDNPRTQLCDGFRRTVRVDWTGWRTLLLNRRNFATQVEPLGWQEIHAVRFVGGEWGITPPKEASLYFDDVYLHLQEPDRRVVVVEDFDDNAADQPWDGWRLLGPEGADLGASQLTVCQDVEPADPNARPWTYGRFDYDCGPVGAQHWVGAQTDIPLPGKPVAIQLLVFGDGSGNRLSVSVRDATEEWLTYSVRFVTWEGWRRVKAYLRTPIAHRRGNEDGRIDPPASLTSVNIEPLGHLRTSSLLFDDVAITADVGSREEL